MLFRGFAVYIKLGRKMKSLSQIVSENPEAFSGAVRESMDTLQQLEAMLDVKLPEDVSWFWLSCGSGDSGAATSAKMSIADTLRFRTAVGLPKQYVVLEDRNDAGSVFLNTVSGAVAWVDAHAVAAFSQGIALPKEQDQFKTFSAWVEDCLELNSD